MGFRSVELEDLLGKTFSAVEKVGDDVLRFHLPEGGGYEMYHSQHCCENVYIESIVGDLSDLVGEPLLLAEEATHEGENPEGVEISKYQASFTWTFYKLATRKGYVDIRWYGESSGYYSESVDVARFQA